MFRSGGRAASQDGIRRWYGITEDIMTRRAPRRRGATAEERLRESEEMHRMTLELSQQIAFTVEAGRSGRRSANATGS